jgi:hypothetical protein
VSLGLFKAITGPLPHPVLLCEADGAVLAANPAATSTLTLPPAGGTLVRDEAARNAFRRQVAGWMRTGSPLPGALVLHDVHGEPVRFRCHGARAAWWDGPRPAVQLHLSRLDGSDQFAALTQQVTALNREIAVRRAAQAERERLLAAEQAARSRLQHLYQLTAALAAGTALADVARAVHDTAPSTLRANRTVLHLDPRRVLPTLDRTDSGLPPVFAVTWYNPDQHQPPDPRRAVDCRLEADGLLLGILTVHFLPAEPPEPEHLVAVAQQIAQAVRRASLHEHEHRVVERLQLSLLPRLPNIDGIDVAGRYAAGTDMVKVGGEWYDLHVLDHEHIGLSIGDVAGHGLAEAAVMAQIAAALRSTVLRVRTSPAAVLHELNDYLGKYLPGQMAPSHYLVYHRPTRRLQYATAGHPPPLVIHTDGTSRFLTRPVGPPLGPIRTASYREIATTLEPGDTLLLYTDGLVERRGESLDTGLQRLQTLIRK